MSSLTLLRQFLNERLSVAAEEIFGAVERIVLDLQNEVSSTKEDRERQRRLLDAVIKPDLKLHRIEPELPSPPVCEQVHSEQQEQSFNIVQDDPEPRQVKVENLWTSQEQGPFPGLDTADSIAPPPCVEERDSENDAQVEGGPLYHSVKVENSRCTNTEGDSDRGHVGFEANDDSQHHSAPVADGFTEEGQYECKVCGKRFKYRGSFKSHTLIHTGEKPYKCRECSLSFRYRGHLNRHKMKHRGEKPFKCKDCGIGFNRKGNLTFHLRHCGERPYQCNECSDCFKSKACLDNHSRGHTIEKPQSEAHSEQKPLERESDVCLVQNDPEPPQIKEEENLWTIQEIREQFQGLDTIDSIAPPPCVEERGYVNDAQLENRICTDTDGEMYREHVGFEPSNEWQNLSAPIPDGFTEEGQYRCKVCGKCFKYKGNLKCHELIHTGEKPYHCKECSLSFRYKGHLNRHKRVHTGEKPYRCEFCGKSFTRNESLTFHTEHQHRELGFIVQQRDTDGPVQIRSQQEYIWTSVGMGRLQSPDATYSVLQPPTLANYCDRDSAQPSCNFPNPSVESRLWPNTHGDTNASFSKGDKNGEVDPTPPSAPIPNSPTNNEKPYQCKVCGKCFKYKSNFNGHKLIHTGEKPYKCKDCSLSFRYKGHLNRHRRVHTGEKPYKCNICGKRFNRKESWAFHKSSHSGSDHIL